MTRRGKASFAVRRSVVRPLRRRRGFSLVELLAVIAIVGILSAVLVPSVTSARAAAAKAQTRVRFNQWTNALESFRTEYGFYPVLDASNLVNPVGQSSDAATTHLFHDILTARRRDRSLLPALTASTLATAPESQNRKLMVFHSFSEAEIGLPDSPVPNLIQDAAGNTEIAILMDRNLDGVIDHSDYGPTLPLVRGMRPGSGDFPDAGIRVGVIFYASSPDATVERPSFVFSWK